MQAQELVKLKAAVHRATTDQGGEEGDPTGLVEIQVLLDGNPQLIAHAVVFIKARIKDRSQMISLLALDLLDQCMRCYGIEFHLSVQEKVLQRILKIAIPNRGVHPRVQKKAAHLIKYWSNAYISDASLKDFAIAGKELASKIGSTPRASPSQTDSRKETLSSRSLFGSVMKRRSPQVSDPYLAPKDCKIHSNAFVAQDADSKSLDDTPAAAAMSAPAVEKPELNSRPAAGASGRREASQPDGGPQPPSVQLVHSHFCPTKQSRYMTYAHSHQPSQRLPPLIILSAP